MATARSRGRSRTSSQVIAERCWTLIIDRRVSLSASSNPMPFVPPERFNIADYFLDARLREGRGDRAALLTDTGTLSYRDVHTLANRFAHVLKESGVEPEQRVIIALPDSPEYVGALFGILKLGAVVVMVNPQLKADAVSYFYE